MVYKNLVYCYTNLFAQTGLILSSRLCYTAEHACIKKEKQTNTQHVIAFHSLSKNIYFMLVKYYVVKYPSPILGPCR